VRGSLADAGRALRVSPAELFAGGEARPGFHAQADQAIEKHRGMTDSNYLQDALRAAATEPLDTCKLCGILINRFYWDTHNRGHA
jgi:hypothetical protein